jgi:cytochrome c peroxidase
VKPKVLAVLGTLLILGTGMAWWWGRFGAPASPAAPHSPVPLDDFTPVELERILQHSPLGNPPPDPTNAFADHPSAQILGQKIFFDPRFSAKGSVACATCHNPSRGLGDGMPLSATFALDRNVPTLWNVAYQRWLFWDGRADTLWSQALQPLENPREQGGSRLQFLHLVASDPALRALYEKVFGPLLGGVDLARFPPAGGPDAVSAPERDQWNLLSEPDRLAVNRFFSNLGKAIHAFERRLISRRSPFDLFVESLRRGERGPGTNLTPQARQGLRIFVGKGNCRVCHSGPAFTDGEFHNLGIPPLRGGPTPFRFTGIEQVLADPFNGKSPYSDDRTEGAKKLDSLVRLPDTWGQVRTPGLRNVARTAPYMHQGQFKTLEQVVHFYSTLEGMLQAGHHERTIVLPLFLEPSESKALVAFLESLTDEDVDPNLLRP